MKRKFLTLGLSLCVLASVCVPGTLAIKADAHSTLVCEKTEHTHTDACYIVSDVPTCGLEAGEGAHAHGGISITVCALSSFIVYNACSRSETGDFRVRTSCITTISNNRSIR